MIAPIETQLTGRQWLLGGEFSLADCAYGPVLNVIEKSGFDFARYANVARYLKAIRARPAWKDTPKLPGL